MQVTISVIVCNLSCQERDAISYDLACLFILFDLLLRNMIFLKDTAKERNEIQWPKTIML